MDIDGVIALNNNWYLDDDFHLSTGKRVPYRWNNECCEVLSKILESTNSYVVISSDWRLSFTIDELKELFTLHNINPDRIIGTTERTKLKKMSEWNQVEVLREREILTWVDFNSVDHWVAIDDLFLSGLPKENFVMVRENTQGINQEIISNILESKLNKDERILF